jgi:hypothetical protein
MTKSVAEFIREYIDMMDEMTDRKYDMELEIENLLEPENEDAPEFITVGINYNYDGASSPASWGPRGGEPPEEPELDYEVFNIETGEPIQDMPEILSDYIENEIMKHIDSQPTYFNEPDRF